MDNRMVGIWSYPIPELFTVRHFPQSPLHHFRLKKSNFNKYDVIFHEDCKCWGRFSGNEVPIVFYVVDSTLSNSHKQARIKQARQADLVLVDHDNLDGFHKRTKRLSHCVNDRLFMDYGSAKHIDVSFLCRTKGSPMRVQATRWLKNFCEQRGYSYLVGKREGTEYARAFNRSKITVNLSRNSINRPHRIFDAMACRTCVLTSELPDVSDEERTAGVHYEEYGGFESLGDKIDYLLASGKWKDVADAGYELVQEHHTWTVRAKQLHGILTREFGLE